MADTFVVWIVIAAVFCIVYIPPIATVDECSTHCAVCFGERCYECDVNWWDRNCTSSCTNCVNGCLQITGECTSRCKSGYYGRTCTLSCLSTCALDCHQTSGKCNGCKNSTSWGNTCLSFCSSCTNGCLQSGVCNSGGCVSGRYGSKCRLACSATCNGTLCDQETGRCTSGCEDGWFGATCDLECPYCAVGCRQPDGMCVNGCINGRYGKTCELSCSTTCNGTVCEQETGHCTNGCQVGRYGVTCNQNCSAKCQMKKGQTHCYEDTGLCLHGCTDGYHGDACDLENVSEAVIGGIIGGVVAFLAIVGTFVAVVTALIRRKRRRAYEDENYDNLNANCLEMEEPKDACGSHESAVYASVDNLSVVRTRLTVQTPDVLGHGRFGAVHKGVLIKDGQPVIVAVKAMAVSANKSESEFFDRAIKHLLILRNNPHMLQLIARIDDNVGKSMLLEYCESRDLLSYLVNLKDETEKSKMKPQGQGPLAAIVMDVVTAMVFLSDKTIVHGSVCAKHVFLDGELKAKLTGFGRPMDDGMVTPSSMSGLLVRWTAPEAIPYGPCRHPTDVWSFGVLMWEMYSFGDIPYSDKADTEISALLETGFKLSIPAGCPDEIYDLMVACWNQKSWLRPTFHHLSRQLTIIYGKLKIKEDRLNNKE